MLMKTCLILFSNLLFIVYTNYDQTPTFRTFRAALWSISDNTVKVNISNYYNFTYNWDIVNTNIVKSQIVWGGYKINTNNKYVSFDLHLDFPTATSVVIGYNVHKDSEIVYTIFYILLLMSNSNQVQINYFQHLSPLLNQSLASRTASDETVTLTSDQFYFASSDKYLVHTFIRSFDIRSIDIAGTQDLQVSFVNLILNTNQFNVKFLSDFNKKTKFGWIRIATVIIYLPSFKSKLIYYSNIISKSLSGSNFSTNFGAAGVFSPSFYSSCVVGLTSFTQTSMTSRPAEIGYIDTGTVSAVSISSLQESNHNYIVFNILCLLVCDLHHFAIGDSCWPCSTAMPGCYSCFTPSVCASCYPDFIFQGGNCVCPKGFKFMTGHCTNMAGCITIILKNNITKCLACNITSKFKLVNNTCLCQAGYYLSNSQTCLEICADGILFNHECDDGNKIDGDGCSSACKVQSKYICYNGSSTHASACVYKVKQFKLALAYADKIHSMNRAIFVFSIFPNILNLNKLNFETAGNFSCQQTIQIVSWRYEDGKIQLLTDYEQDLEGNYATLQILFNLTIIDHAPIKVEFPMVSRGSKLLVMRQYDKIRISDIFLNVIGVLAMVIYLMGSFCHKMIGVETLQCFQIIFLSHSLSNNFTDGFYQFNFLSTVAANFGSFVNNSTSIAHPNDAFPFKIENKELATLAILSLCLISCICYLLIKVAQKRKLILTNRWSGYIFNHAIFPSFVGFYLINILIRALRMNKLPILYFDSFPLIISAICQLFLLASTSLIYFNQWKIYLLRKFHLSDGLQIDEFSQCKFAYVPLYLTFFFCFSIAIFAGYQQFSMSRYILMSIMMVYVLWIIFYQPYDKKIHNAAQIFNSLLMFFFLVWSIVRENNPSLQEEDTQILIVLISLILMGLSLLLSILRIANEICSIFCSNKLQKKQKVKFVDNKNQNFAIKKLYQETLKEQKIEKKTSIIQSSMRQKLIKSLQSNKQIQKMKQQFRSQFLQRRLFKDRIVADNQNEALFSQ